MSKAMGFWHSSPRTAHGRITRSEAVSIAKKKFGKGKYTIGFTKSVGSPSPELIRTLGRKVLGL